MLVDIEDLLDTSQVAALLGLSHRNSVVTYMNRYPEFPAPVVVRPRMKLWRAQDIEAWQRGAPDTRTEDRAEPRTAILAAARRLMRECPAGEVSVREIAEAAGVSHVVIYRYFEGKEHLRRAVIDEVMAEVTARTQKGDDGEQTLRRAVDAALDVSPDFRILAFSVLTGDSRSAFSTPPVMAALLQQLRTQQWRSPLSDQQVVALLGALVLGWGTFEQWIREATGMQGDLRDALDVVIEALVAPPA